MLIKCLPITPAHIGGLSLSLSFSWDNDDDDDDGGSSVMVALGSV